MTPEITTFVLTGLTALVFIVLIVSQNRDKIRRRSAQLACLMGRHDWKSDSDNFRGEVANEVTSVIWWNCQRDGCSACRIKFISK